MILRFLKNIIAFSIVIFILIVFYIYSFNLGQLDFYYKRISSPKQSSMILGNSRAAQGLVPKVINEVMKLEFAPIYNFSFTASYSPYGEVYYNSIVTKIKDDIKDGVFIVTVDPGSISALDEDPNNESEPLDNKSFLNHLKCFSCNPNFDYILYGHETFYKKVFLNMVKGRGYLHDDGWLEMKLPNDSLSRVNRLKSKLSNKSYATEYVLSETRLEYLKKTIDFLKGKGEVYLVRLPMDKNILDRQLEAFPEFEELMISISQEKNVPYTTFFSKSENYQYSDGSHLTSESALKISKDLAIILNSFR